MHQHKNPGTLTCKVTTTGHVYLLLGEKATPPPVKNGPEWKRVGAIKRNGGSVSIPGKIGARDSRLFKLLEKGHHGVVLEPDELRRITLWLDCNSNFYGAYREPEAQARGKLVMPTVW